MKGKRKRKKKTKPKKRGEAQSLNWSPSARRKEVGGPTDQKSTGHLSSPTHVIPEKENSSHRGARLALGGGPLPRKEC